MSASYQILRPVAYLAVKHDGLRFFRLTIPLVATCGALLLFFLLPVRIDLVGDKSAADYMAGFFATLPGFYIAALAAVATFNGGDLDVEMPDAKVPMSLGGVTEDQELSLRLFLCYLFSYLTVLSFIGFIVCVGGSLLQPSFSWMIKNWFSDSALVIGLLSGVFFGLITWLGASVCACTAQGLYFLGERVHQTFLNPPKAEHVKSCSCEESDGSPLQ